MEAGIIFTFWGGRSGSIRGRIETLSLRFLRGLCGARKYLITLETRQSSVHARLSVRQELARHEERIS